MPQRKQLFGFWRLNVDESDDAHEKLKEASNDGNVASPRGGGGGGNGGGERAPGRDSHWRHGLAFSGRRRGRRRVFESGREQRDGQRIGPRADAGVVEPCRIIESGAEGSGRGWGPKGAGDAKGTSDTKGDADAKGAADAPSAAAPTDPNSEEIDVTDDLGRERVYYTDGRKVPKPKDEKYQEFDAYWVESLSAGGRVRWIAWSEGDSFVRASTRRKQLYETVRLERRVRTARWKFDTFTICAGEKGDRDEIARSRRFADRASLTE